MAFETLDSQVVYQGRAFDVRRDQVRLPDGKFTTLDVVAHRGAVTLVPMDDKGQVFFVRQYRHPAGQTLLELPAGVMEVGEKPEDSALREVREETGMAAGRLEKLGEFFLAPGYSTEYMHVFLATDLHPAPLKQDEDEFLSLEKIALNQVFELAESGQIMDAKSLAALLLLRSYLARSGGD